MVKHMPYADGLPVYGNAWRVLRVNQHRAIPGFKPRRCEVTRQVAKAKHRVA
jgi:hypothetical protein